MFIKRFVYSGTMYPYVSTLDLSILPLSWDVSRIEKEYVLLISVIMIHSFLPLLYFMFICLFLEYLLNI